MLALLLILIVAFFGLAAVPMWCVPLAAITLASISYAQRYRLFRRAHDLGLQDEIDWTLVGSLLNSLAASMVAYGFGVALRFLSVGWQ